MSHATILPQTVISPRAAGIVIHNDQLLLIYRKKNNDQYYTFPGGTVEEYETTENCAAREIFEETSIHVKMKNLVYQLEVISTSTIKHEYFYLAEYISGTPNLQPTSVEAMRVSSNNIYQPMWMPLEKVSEIKLYPIEIRNHLIQDVQNGFNPEIYQLKIHKSEMKNS